MIPLNSRAIVPASPKGAIVKPKAKHAGRLQPGPRPQMTGKSHVKLRTPRRAETSDDVRALVSRSLAKGTRAFVDEAVGDCEPAWPAPRRRRGIAKLFASYDPGSRGTVSRRDCCEVLRSLGVSVSDDELNRLVDRCADDRTGRVKYSSLLQDPPTVSSRGSYAAQYAAEKQKEREQARRVETQLCGMLEDTAQIATLRRKLRNADASGAGSLAPCDFARALREYTGEPLDDADETALCTAYDHRVPARLLEDTDEGMKSPLVLKPEENSSSAWDAPLESPRRARRDDDDGARAFVDRRLFVKRQGAGSNRVQRSQSDDAMRAALWRTDPDKASVPATPRAAADDEGEGRLEAQRPVGFRPALGRSHREPAWDGVNYERFLDDLERQADDLERLTSSPKMTGTRRRAVRKIASALSNDDERTRWAREFVGSDGGALARRNLDASEAATAVKDLGLNLTNRELKEAIELGSDKTRRFDASKLAIRALEAAAELDTEDEARREAQVEKTRTSAERRRKGAGLSVRPTSLVLRTKSPSAVTRRETPDSAAYYYVTRDNKPVVFRSAINRPHVANENVPPAAGVATTTAPCSNRSQSPSRRLRDAVSKDAADSALTGLELTRHERRERLTLERAAASVARRASRARLAAALEALPADEVGASDLSRALASAGAPLGSRDAARLVVEAAAGSREPPSRRRVAELLLDRAANDEDGDLGKSRSRRARVDLSRDFLTLNDDDEQRCHRGAGHKKLSPDAQKADAALRRAVEDLAAAPNPTFASSFVLASPASDASTPRRGRESCLVTNLTTTAGGLARRTDSHPWQWDDVAPRDANIYPALTSRDALEATRCARAAVRPRNRSLSAPPKRSLFVEEPRSSSVPRPLRAFIAEQEQREAHKRILV